jgi:hypothetical protein
MEGNAALSRKDSDSVFVLALADLVGLDQEGTKPVPLAQCNNLTTEGGCHQRSAESTVPTSCLTTEPTHKGASRDLAEATATTLGGFHLPFTARGISKV